MLDKLDKFHNSIPGYLLFGAFGLIISYVFISFAIDSGNWFDYLIAFLGLIVFLQNSTKLITTVFSSKRKKGRL